MVPVTGESEGGCSNKNESGTDNVGPESPEENSSESKPGKPPRNTSVMRHSASHAVLAGIPHLEAPLGISGSKSPSTENSEFLPVFRSGSCSEMGPKTYMEDEFICVDNLQEHLGGATNFPSPGAFYGVFDGHGGVDAASFTRKNILKFIVEDSHFPGGVKRAIRNAFVKADHELADSKTLDSSSGTTALTALVLGRPRAGGSCSEMGPKTYMEDEFICVDNLQEHLGGATNFPSPGAFYGVFDGHGGVDAASFTRKNILKFIVEDPHFPGGVKRAIRNAFVKADHELADSKTLDSSSGTTALTALVLGRTMLIANAGDCRAVLGKRGRAIELSKDHKPNSRTEKLRIEKLGGVIYDGYLNGQLSVARALGDWHLKGPKGRQYPLSSEPELEELVLAEEDEFLIMACDGLWDVMSSQYAVTVVRKELMVHNDPEKCSKLLVREALRRNTCDNLTAVVVCFSRDPPPRIEVPRSSRRRSISAEGLDLLKGVLSDI